MIIPYWIGGDRHGGRVDYAVDLLLSGLGHQGTRVDDPAHAVIRYNTRLPVDREPGALWIRAEPVTDWDAAPSVQAVARIARELDERKADGWGAADWSCRDVLYATYVVVTGGLERTLPRDQVGVPRFRGIGSELEQLLDTPFVARCTEYLGDRLAALYPDSVAERVPRWPDGKRCVIVVSHDVDAPFSRPSPAFYLRRALRRFGDHGWRGSIASVLAGAKSAALFAAGRVPAPEADPNLCFEAWRSVEASLGGRSCHYVAVTTSADPAGAAQDVDYDFRHPVLVGEMRRLIDAGWEIGLHASINARRDASRISSELHALESVFGRGVATGVRHHWWALDPIWPERTFRAHTAAGLSYDSSFGANDAMVFRRGMVWPYFPFDRELNRPTTVLQVPPTLMDGAIFYYDQDAIEGDRRITDHIDDVARAGGMVVLDWHLEQLNPARLRGAGSSLTRALTSFAGASDVLWALPRDIDRWWRDREARRTSLSTLLRPTSEPSVRIAR